MKKITFFLIGLINFLNPEFTIAQEKLNKGKATFKFIYPDEQGISENLLSVAEVKGITVYFKNGKSRAEYKDENNSVVIVDPKTKEKIRLQGDKLAIKMTFEEAQKNQTMIFGDSAATITNETKVVAGYKCKKAIINYEVWQRPNRTIEIWFTNELAATNTRFTFKGIDGFIMEYSYVDILYPTKEGVDFRETMTCIKVEKVNVADSLFKVPASYHVVTMEEMKKNVKVEYH